MGKTFLKTAASRARFLTTLAVIGILLVIAVILWGAFSADYWVMNPPDDETVPRLSLWSVLAQMFVTIVAILVVALLGMAAITIMVDFFFKRSSETPTLFPTLRDRYGSYDTSILGMKESLRKFRRALTWPFRATGRFVQNWVNSGE